MHMNDSVKVLAIRGAPGIGKSTVGELLRSFIPKGAIIDIDNIRRMIVREEFQYGRNEDYFNAIRVSSQLISSLLETGCSPIVVVDVFAIEAWQLFRKSLGHYPLVSISLYASDEVLCNRMKCRGDGGYIDMDVAVRVNQHIFDTRNETNDWIDTTRLTPQEVRHQVMKHVGRAI